MGVDEEEAIRALLESAVDIFKQQNPNQRNKCTTKFKETAKCTMSGQEVSKIFGEICKERGMVGRGYFRNAVLRFGKNSLGLYKDNTTVLRLKQSNICKEDYGKDEMLLSSSYPLDENDNPHGNVRVWSFEIIQR